MKKSIPKKPSQFLIKIGLVSILLLLCSQSIAQAQSVEQNELSKNSAYLNVAGGALAQVSVNYERQIHSGEKVSWYGRIGACYAAILMGEEGIGGLGAITMLTGKENGHFELNAGVFLGKGERDSFLFPLFNIGYRYQKPEGGFVFRANVGVPTGISIGYAF